MNFSVQDILGFAQTCDLAIRFYQSKIETDPDAAQKVEYYKSLQEHIIVALTTSPNFKEYADQLMPREEYKPSL